MQIRFIIIACLLLVLSCSEKQNKNALLTDNSDLKVKTPVDSSLKRHAADTFRINLPNNAFVYGYADQLTVDVVVEIYDPANKKVASFDSPARGPEPYQFKTTSAGIYRIVISPFEDNEGKYSLVLSNAEPIATTPDSRIEQILAAHLNGDDVTPGISVAVARDGKIVYSKGFGYANLEYEIKNTPQTVFHIASVSKQFTAFAIATLADQGKISLSDDIRKYLPELNDFGHVITIDHLVHHTSGLRDQWNLLAMAGWRLDDVITKNQIMRLISRQKDLNFKPGDEMLYCNTGFTLMGEIVSRVTGLSFAEWTKQNIFDPLEMKNTFFYDDHERVVKNRAYSYYKSATGFKKSVLSYANAGATSLFTTVGDLSIWAMNFEKIKVGNENVMRMMNNTFVLNKGDTIKYAFGQVIDKYKGLKTISHGGADAGYRTFFLRVPEQNFSVSVFSNLASFNPGGLSYEIADLYLSEHLKEEPKKPEPIPATTAASQPQEPPFDPSSINLNEFTGKFYSSELETSYTLVIKNDTLIAQHQRHDDIPLLPKKRDQFSANTWFIGNVEFIRNKLNRIQGLKVSNGRVRNLVFDKQ